MSISHERISCRLTARSSRRRPAAGVIEKVVSSWQVLGNCGYDVTMHSRIRVLLPVTAVAVLAVVAGRAALGGTASATATTRPIDTGVVVIETNLGLQGGRAAGTGMVLTRAGEVVTNNHVIAGATSITVIVPESGRIATATVAGYDVSADVAVLRLSGAARHSTVSLGHSSALRVGQLVRAVGNARGAGRLTLVRGQVTGLGRSITVATDEGEACGWED